MKKQDIRKAYTDQVAQLLNQGYTIFPDTMRGSQGEIAHIDLSNGSEIVRVLLEREMYRGNLDDGFDGNVIILTVGRAAPDTRLSDNWDGDLWNNRLEHISQIKWLELTDRGEGWYTTVDEAPRIGRLRAERYSRRDTYCRRELGTAYKSVALRWVRKLPRMRSCRLEDIESVVTSTHGRGRKEILVCVKGKWYHMR